MVSHIRDYQHIIIDTEGNPTDDDFKRPRHQLRPAGDSGSARERSDGRPDAHPRQAPKPRQHDPSGAAHDGAPKPRTEGQQLRDMLTAESIPVFKSEIPRLAAFEKAAAEGVPVYGVKDDRNAARAWSSYEEVGKEITNG